MQRRIGHCLQNGLPISRQNMKILIRDQGPHIGHPLFLHCPANILLRRRDERIRNIGHLVTDQVIHIEIVHLTPYRNHPLHLLGVAEQLNLRIGQAVVHPEDIAQVQALQKRIDLIFLMIPEKYRAVRVLLRLPQAL